ncbi:MAG: recombinase family protein [Firmicutes bacterium]|nr:recombinase family protein [Bacillota bacterium]
MKANEGELPRFHVENSHPAIVSEEIFDSVQAEVARRKELGLRNSSAGIFSSKIMCGDCDSFFGSKVWHSNTKYRRKIWQCRHKFKSVKKCKTPHFYENELKKVFLKAFNQIVSDKNQILSDCEVMLIAFMNTAELEEKIRIAQEKFDNIEKLIESYIKENATSKLNQKEYRAKYSEYLKTYENEKITLETLQNLKIERKIKTQKIKDFINKIKENDALITEFSEELFFATVEKITANADKSLLFAFKNGIDITSEK